MSLASLGYSYNVLPSRCSSLLSPRTTGLAKEAAPSFLLPPATRRFALPLPAATMEQVDVESPTWRSEKRWMERGSTLRVVMLLLLWYSTSVLASITTKEILMRFPYPITVAMVQQAVAAFCGWCTAQMERRGALRDWRLHLRTFAPVAIPLVVALISYRWALMATTVAFTSTVKTLGPVFTVVFARLMLQERLSARQYSSVVPVVLGVAITTITEAEFIFVGFVAAIISTAAQALQTVVSKHVLREREERLLGCALLCRCLVLLAP
ncbi:hypothetical protein AB1Y20_009906 [Prymnesium parvum]|uniref:Sugar phosphate transporter domain-containing protein n=1 Tax=Prymnesium parvum TaxID=97485 RepID=A0AB34K5K6_PRYPA